MGYKIIILVVGNGGGSKGRILLIIFISLNGIILKVYFDNFGGKKEIRIMVGGVNDLIIIKC